MTGAVPVARSWDALSLAAIVVGSLLVTMGAFTLGRVVVAARRERRAVERRDALRAELLTRLYDDDPAWDEWIAAFDRTDRRVVRSVLRAQLRWVDGWERERLQTLAERLGVDAWALELLASPDRHRRLLGLTWLRALDRSVDADWLVDRCRGHADTRAAGARLLVDTGHPAARRVGGSLLLADGEPLSVLGVDTLYQLYRHDAERLAERVREAEGWDESLTIQVLQVFGECAAVGPTTSLELVTARLDADSPRVRRAALNALSPYGWRADVRAAVAAAAPTEDPSPELRGVGYRLYGEWATDDAVARLSEALRTETDGRARVAAARALRDADALPRTSRDADGDAPGTDRRADPAVEWVAARAEAGR